MLHHIMQQLIRNKLREREMVCPHCGRSQVQSLGVERRVTRCVHCDGLIELDAVRPEDENETGSADPSGDAAGGTPSADKESEAKESKRKESEQKQSEQKEPGTSPGDND